MVVDQTKPGDQRDRKYRKDSTRLEFLQSQLTYFASHLSLADAKAAGIMVFSVAMSGVTAEKIHWHGMPSLIPKEVVGLAGLLCSFVAMLFAFLAIWPRTAPGRLKDDVFSWVGVAGYSHKGSHAKRALTASNEEILEGIADTTESLAVAISRKYVAIRRAFWALAPATLAHIAYWVLS